MPVALRGTTSGAKMIHISDWCALMNVALISSLSVEGSCDLLNYVSELLRRYPTFCNLAGVDPTDTVMFKGKMRPIEYEECARD